MNHRLRRFDWPKPGRRFRRWVLRAGAASLALASLLALDAVLAANSWRIEGVDARIEQQVDAVLRDMQPLGLLRMRPARVCAKLLAETPDVAGCQGRRQLPNHLLLMLEPTLPVAMWEHDEGLMLVDEAGRAYRRMGQMESLDLPLLRTSRADLPRAAEILRALRQPGAAWLPQLSECIASDTSWKLLFGRQQRWLLPKDEDASARAAELASMLEQGRWQSGDWLVDARLEARWFIRQTRNGGVI
ncbi:MAG: cell division protein FtsQ/DivIB [Mariprofundaceae bacterium]